MGDQAGGLAGVGVRHQHLQLRIHAELEQKVRRELAGRAQEPVMTNGVLRFGKGHRRRDAIGPQELEPRAEQARGFGGHLARPLPAGQDVGLGRCRHAPVQGLFLAPIVDRHLDVDHRRAERLVEHVPACADLGQAAVEPKIAVAQETHVERLAQQAQGLQHGALAASVEAG